jgi:hypothetical protein
MPQHDPPAARRCHRAAWLRFPNPLASDAPNEMAELMLTLNCAAARRVAPASTAAITRSRKSSEYAFAIPTPKSRGSESYIHNQLKIPS